MTIEAHDQNFWGIVLAGVSASLVLGHNLWLVATDRVSGIGARGGGMRIEVNTSDKFPESESAVRPERVADFRLVSESGSVPVPGYRVEGQSLVAVIEPPRDSASLVALELHPHPITLEAKRFAHYVQEEEAEAMVAPRFRAGVTASPQREYYTKYAKLLLESDAQKNEIHGSIAGHRLEIIPRINPTAFLRGGGRLSVQVLFEGKPIAGLRVSCGCEDLRGGGYVAHARTDEQGHAALEISGAGHWFVRAHYIRPHPDPAVADWESFWASVSFRLTP